ncbi:acyclic terpene utilization AtuA family protein [Arthrobacter sp. YN]|uniref:acyclic terpene utilization AtuA family protein n=1 Tax=Arthrobacter sp. YN TaxID=2020486 RepID=UPI000B5E2757|nr:acyclic terpene utilization AtuA family protein [Arthrobacter sp. YN]ASN19973.1 ABC transporter substrate-binding protein [Arthrobacter sp. YN]
MNTPDIFRIGAGSGFAGDRYEPAEILARHGNLHALVFECLAERTIALAQQERHLKAGEGYDRRLLRRLRSTLPLATGMRILTNAGAANPVAAGLAVRSLAKELNLPSLRVAAVSGDDVLSSLNFSDSQILGTEETLADIGDRIISANAYLGADAIMGALTAEADVVITGRVGDAALFLAPLIHHFGWNKANLELMAKGTLVGHLLECAGQLTGGYFADGRTKEVEGLASLGFPLAEVSPTGAAEYSKIDGTGGLIDRRTVLEQLLYEIDSPDAYITPDVIVDLSGVNITERGPNRVHVDGARAAGRPDQLKVSVGVRDGYLSVGEIIYSGPGALIRAELAARILTERWQEVHGYSPARLRADYVGHNSTRSWWTPTDCEPPEVRLRMSATSLDQQQAVVLAEEVEALYTNGPAGGGGVTTSVKQTIGVVSTMIPRESVSPTVEVFE